MVFVGLRVWIGGFDGMNLGRGRAWLWDTARYGGWDTARYGGCMGTVGTWREDLLAGWGGGANLQGGSVSLQDGRRRCREFAGWSVA